MAEINQGIINYGSIGGDASVRIVQHNSDLASASRQLAGSGLDPALVGQLTALVADMQLALRKLPSTDAASASALTGAVKRAMQDIAAAGPRDKKSIEISAKGMLEAAQGLAGVLPIAAKIAATVAGAFGLML
jgi:hypothetical protein